MKDLLKEELESLSKQRILLEKILNKLEDKIDVVIDEELEKYEVLCARYARGVDYLR